MDRPYHSFQPPPPPPPPPPPVQQHHHYPYAHSHQLAPIQQHAAYPPPTTQTELPPLRNPSAPPPPPVHEQHSRNASEHHAPEYYPHNRSAHATPAPVNRSHPHDTAPQHTPTTPAGPPPIPHSQAQEGAPQQPSHPHHPPPPPPMEHAPQHHAYPPQHALPHGMPQQHHDMQPQYAPPVMEGHAYSQQPIYPNPGYGPPSAGMYNGVGKRKHMRATQACEQCRQRKQKCDEGNPCSFCKENGMACQYRDTPPAKTDKNMEKLLSFMENSSQQLQRLADSMNDNFANMDRRLKRLEQPSNANNYEKLPSPAPARESYRHPSSAQSPPTSDPPVRNAFEDHRNSAHKLLLLWPSIRPLLEKAQVRRSASYVSKAEDRAPIRLYTRGEGSDDYDGTAPGGPSSPSPSEESGDISSAPTPHGDGIWGFGFPATPVSGDMRRTEPVYNGGLKSNGELDLDHNTIYELFDSYMHTIHRMHPIFDRRRLRQLIGHFAKRYSGGTNRSTTAAFVTTASIDSDSRPTKRQRSNGSSSASAPGVDMNGPVARGQRIERSPRHIVILLVLALGKICAHKEPLPGLVSDARAIVAHRAAGNNSLAGSSPASMHIKHSPMSPKSTPASQPTPPSDGLRNESRSRRSSIDGQAASVLRNMDIIPGLAYWNKAMELLGDQADGDDLIHAQMFLLAGLYKGQLARVKESMSWYCKAGRIIIGLLDRNKPKLWNGAYFNRPDESGQENITDPRTSMIVICAWACLQLETDILAELKLPASGISDYENYLILPKKVDPNESYADLDTPQHADDDLIIYSSQLWLRKRLNTIQKDLYGSGCLGMSLPEVKETLIGHEAILESWRGALPPHLKWGDDQNQNLPTDVLTARLRAKYWGAKYVINRPFLDYALHIMPYVIQKVPMEQAATDADGNPRNPADVQIFKAIATFSPAEIWARVRSCQDAAMNSTVAFDGVPGRPVITNIHGTAHAQFGNILVLAACHESEHLSGLIDKPRFRELLERTISFLKRLAPISPTCAADCRILEKFNMKLFPVPPDIKNHYINEGLEPASASNSFIANS